MRADAEKLAACRERLASLHASPPGEDSLGALLELRRELALHAPQASGSTDHQRVALVKQYLSIAPLVLPDDAQATLRSVATGLSRRLWSLDLLARIDAQLEHVVVEQARARDQLKAMRERIARGHRRRDVLRDYLALMDAFIPSAAGERTGS